MPVWCSAKPEKRKKSFRNEKRVISVFIFDCRINVCIQTAEPFEPTAFITIKWVKLKLFQRSLLSTTSHFSYNSFFAWNAVFSFLFRVWWVQYFKSQYVYVLFQLTSVRAGGWWMSALIVYPSYRPHDALMVFGSWIFKKCLSKHKNNEVYVTTQVSNE